MPPCAKREIIIPARVCVRAGDVNLKVSAEALKTDRLCGNEVASVPDVGQIDTVIRTLLVEVSEDDRAGELVHISARLYHH